MTEGTNGEIIKDPVAPVEGNTPAATDGDGVKSADTDWKAKHDEQGYAMRQAQKVNAAQEDQIKALEAKMAEPLETDERIANLEVQLARSNAVSRFGLTEDQADRLKGSPAEILADAEYWAGQKPVDKTATAPTSNKEMIDAEVSKPAVVDPIKPAVPAAPVPTATNSQASWIDRYKAATPAVRYTMDEEVKSGLVKPF